MSDRKHVHILSELYAHPIAHNITWHALIPALASIGLVHADKNGGRHFTRNGHTIELGHVSSGTLDTEEVVKLRHFISASAASSSKSSDLMHDIIVAIDHQKAIIFHDPGMASETRTVEHADQSTSRVLHKHPTNPPFENDGPEIDKAYYDALVKAMSAARRVVILGHGTSASNAASQLMAKIAEKDPEIGHRVAAIQRCDLEAMTEPQMISLGKQLLSTEHSR